MIVLLLNFPQTSGVLFVGIRNSLSNSESWRKQVKALAVWGNHRCACSCAQDLWCKSDFSL